ncbi:glycogen/starch/alpha-glucan phosphorylase [Cellulomonas sp. H30R-01]|uniref:glycogen/starch/alpha-glucan phosphorylase n=1 Tax=Cellulomonas sp. H30R-01 TaxID=2704467 RepID=UPI00138C6DCF|nr:glycogen/starch/alpha-glucan phosphorylase [Cellulomonas sp. H30R-01]QHT57252.1 glycogen/starch/alpha-glucan phosphorylase [Cellulomonas sp. H30R-01]
MSEVTANTEPVATRERTVEGFVREYLRELNFGQGVDLSRASVNDQYLALARTVRHYLMVRWLETLRRQSELQAKSVAYLSAEFLLGRQLDNALLAADLTDIVEEGLAGLGISLDTLRQAEVEPGLGNGGLGRLAACFIDSLATMNVPSIGYGIRYEYGIFRQTFVDGWQVEKPDSWLTLGSPWEFPHPEMAVNVSFGGTVEDYEDDDGTTRKRWLPGWSVLGVPYNYMVPGYGNGRVNTLRLWSARATRAFDLEIFNSGDYAQAVRAQTFAENISKVLYPEDSTPQGKELRLQQQYFFVACSLKDFVDQVLPKDFDLTNLPDRIHFQLNDTHPVIAIPELMRILVDEKKWSWDDAWSVVRQVFSYTCHTLLPEALEVWSVELLGRLLPRHLEIIYRINEQFLVGLRAAYPDDELRARRMSIIAEFPERGIRMAHLATVAAVKVNGVAALHSQLLRDKVLHDFAEYYPGKFTNVTNGITPRRFLRLSNPGLSGLVTEVLGSEKWVTDLDELRALEPLAEDAEFRRRFRDIKAANKRRLVDLLAQRDGIVLDPETMFDVMVKRLHEYKRQTLKLLHVVSLYEQITSGALDPADVTPRTFAFGAKAAPGYRMAKQIIGLINAVGRTVNADPAVEGRLTIAFPANYNVTLAETLIPAADLSEQISLAGKEASGTGNMKFMLNGALTIGTDDGANVEIRELVGDENFFLFGLTEPEVADVVERGYHPTSYYETNPQLRHALDLVASGAFSDGDRSVFEPVVSNLLHEDRFLVLADFQAYADAQARVDAAYADPEAWTRSAIINVARAGFFSSDRSMRDYLDRVWHAAPVDPSA